MFAKLYLLSGLVLHASMLGLLLRYLEGAGVSVRDSITGILTQGATLFEEASAVAEDAGLVSVNYLPFSESEAEPYEPELDVSGFEEGSEF